MAKGTHGLKEQFGNEKNENNLSGDYFLLYLVLFVLATFYFIIMWVLSSSNNDRIDRLGRLKPKAH